MSNPNIFNPAVGALRLASISDISEIERGKVKVKLTNAPYHQPDISIFIPQNLALNNGLFLGAKPSVGTTVVLGTDNTGKYHFISYYVENSDRLPSLEDKEILISANSRTQMTFNGDNSDIYLGSIDNKLHINTSYNLLSTNFNDEHHFTQASRKITGLIKRERRDKTEYTQFDLNSRLTNDDYDSKYKVITLDPTASLNPSSAGGTKNPSFVESREIIYEFQDSANVRDDISEASLYKDSSVFPFYGFTNRRKSKADTLSLSLSYPNYLIETVKGTVVDIFGNILDLNRFPLPVGKEQNTLNSDNSTDKYKSFLKIKELERKSIAYHFEINARKDFAKQSSQNNNISDLFGYNAKFPESDYGRLRSRFFIDIDKEGQFKLNVPASSEAGNIPLLTRYENFTNLSPEDNNNPDKLIYRDDLLDILHDSFASPILNLGEDSTAGNFKEEPGSITVKQGDSILAMQDRRYENVHLKHGTAYHDILTTCYAHQKNTFLNYTHDKTLNANLFENIPLLKNIVKDTIVVGENAGGRSGSINFDGSIEMNIGANTSDRQSLWLDTAGGMVANVGRDLNNRSAAVSMNGDVFIQVGGRGVVGDSRFVKQQNGQISAVLDLRVFNDGLSVTMIRIDNNGVTIMTPNNLNIHARSEIKINASKIDIDAEYCTIMGRSVKKVFGGSI